jgi:hypothetical protein
MRVIGNSECRAKKQAVRAGRLALEVCELDLVSVRKCHILTIGSLGIFEQF